MDLANSTVSGNSAEYGGGICSEHPSATVNLTNSTVSGNSGDYGGGIYNYEGTSDLTNSTVSGNTATNSGGGILNEDGTVNLTNSTVSGNTATEGGGIYNAYAGATVNLTNTIIADQLAGGDCSGAPLVTSNDYNLDSDGSCNLIQPNDKPSGNANLGPLQLNAPGNTATHALLVGSDAIDTGDCTGGTITTDQRGQARPQSAGCDIGAYEAAFITVNSTADVIADDGECTLREAIIAANTNTASGAMAGECSAGQAAPTVYVIIFTDPPGSPDLYTLTIAGTGEDAAATGDLDITEDLTITGNGQAETIIQAGTDETNGIDRVFHVFAEATFEDVTIRHGRATGSFPHSDGGGIYNDVGATVHLTNSTVSGNSASHDGGGINNHQGTVNLVSSTVSGNSAYSTGGGIYNEGSLDLANSTVSGNTGGSGGGILNHGGAATVSLTNSTVTGNSADYDGGGICSEHPGATVNLTNSTVSGNSGDYGGGIYNYEGTSDLTNSTVSGNTATNSGGGILNEDGTVNLTNSTVSGNFAGNYGGGIYNEDGTLDLTNSTVSGNTADRNGGGIFNYEAPATVNLINSTVSGNTATDGGGIYNYELGAVVNLTNTIVADQLAGGDCSGAIPVTSNDYNLDSDGSCNLTQPNDKPNNPSANLGPLQLNAPGNTATHALLAGSDAIDTGDGSGGTITTDQRGVPRPQGAACDMGAYEFQATTIPGNCDGDGDVDLDDYTGFEACLLGPDGGLGTGCECFDFDNDHDVDLDDFAEFQVNFTGN